MRVRPRAQSAKSGDSVNEGSEMRLVAQLIAVDVLQESKYDEI